MFGKAEAWSTRIANVDVRYGCSGRLRNTEAAVLISEKELITPDGKERLLDDRLTEALPVWSPDSSKVADAFDTDVMIYDAASNKPTQARIRLQNALVAASRIYEERTAGGKKKSDNNDTKAGESSAGQSAIPASFNRLFVSNGLVRRNSSWKLPMCD